MVIKRLKKLCVGSMDATSMSYGLTVSETPHDFIMVDQQVRI